MSHSGFRKKGRSGALLCGTFAAIPHPVAAEVTARSGADFVCIDWEHAQIGRGEIENLVRAIEAGGAVPMVRVPGNNAEAIAAALDSGAQGILVPRVSSAAEATAAARAMRYPPDGERGAGPGRASAYGYDIASYIEKANRRLLLAVQVETGRAVEAIEEIVAVEEVDVVFIGPGDLAVSLGALGTDGAATLEAAMERVLSACRSARKAVGLFRPDASDIARWKAAGASFFIIASDTMFLGAAAAASLGTAGES
ncbi:HpcH/HpaI aldolase/citrate lyase family protein [Aurantimonas sp. VKM B-3413]|uniref:HpcH/HpaI aldolase family protein n=1 Tax=Aurantimonas sp. VKM B-3413 TaxID=2779401 RepID=UPI001E508732|nr:aldolase/citrate lyase family protein [Aurantimonas sp. VKM B-3413]MCB8840324.1 4-hydroxy-2-oxovalerate aldolase [Aurantimonas sp. VKM B-3413]